MRATLDTSVRGPSETIVDSRRSVATANAVTLSSRNHIGKDVLNTPGNVVRQTNSLQQTRPPVVIMQRPEIRILSHATQSVIVFIIRALERFKSSVQITCTALQSRYHKKIRIRALCSLQFGIRFLGSTKGSEITGIRYGRNVSTRPDHAFVFSFAIVEHALDTDELAQGNRRSPLNVDLR